MFVLQATDASCLASTGNGWTCMLDAFVAAAGSEALFGFIVGGLLVLSIYIGSSYHPAPPAVLVILLGGILIPALPARYQTIGQTIMVVGFITGVFFAGRRYLLTPGR